MSRKVFVTGVTGYLGSAIAPRIVRAGHEVYGLTRDAGRAAGLEALGIQPVIGDLGEPSSYIGVLKNCDDAIHAAIDADAAAADHAALESLRDAAEDGRLRRVLYTSGCWVIGNTGEVVADETTPLAPVEHSRWRAAHEEVALDLVDHEVNVVIFRPGIVYGEWRGILGAMFAEARERGTVTWPGDGSQHWPLVHRDDVAEAYALAIERAEDGGRRYILVDDSRHVAREIAEAIARVTGAAAHGLDAEELVRAQGSYGQALLTDQRLSAARARRELGWVPRHGSFVQEADDLYREWQDSQGTPVG